jgi:AraC-type DNA-binding domain-containing proteins
MEQSEIIEIVQKMQDYIKENVEQENFNLDRLFEISGFSKRHSIRIFKKLTGMTPENYVRAIRLSESAKRLLNTKESVLDIALDFNYESNEGYTRAFSSAFSISPNQYRKNPVAIPLFTQYPVRAYFNFLRGGINKMSDETFLCTITIIERPKRKIILLQSSEGRDYWSFCDEMGCAWEGLLNSIPEKYDTAAILELPEHFVKKGKSRIAAGVEVPYDYSAKIPDGYDTIELDPVSMLYFQSEPLKKDNDFGMAIDSVMRSINKYDVNKYGFEYDFNSAPKFNFGASTEMGAKMALPVRKIN